jgi:hypothetical protein
MILLKLNGSSWALFSRNRALRLVHDGASTVIGYFRLLSVIIASNSRQNSRRSALIHSRSIY